MPLPPIPGILSARKVPGMKFPSTGREQCPSLLSSGLPITSGPSGWGNTPPESSPLGSPGHTVWAQPMGGSRAGRAEAADLLAANSWERRGLPLLAQKHRRLTGPTLGAGPGTWRLDGPEQLRPHHGVGWGQGEHSGAGSQRAEGFLPEGGRTGGVWVVGGRWGRWAGGGAPPQ